jgi:hypothetical protein
VAVKRVLFIFLAFRDYKLSRVGTSQVQASLVVVITCFPGRIYLYMCVTVKLFHNELQLSISTITPDGHYKVVTY